MITKNKLKSRVTARKQELTAEQESLYSFRNKLTAFADEIKRSPVVYGLVKSLSVWKELEVLLTGGDSGED